MSVNTSLMTLNRLYSLMGSILSASMQQILDVVKVCLQALSIAGEADAL